MNRTVHTLHAAKGPEAKVAGRRGGSCFYCPSLSITWDYARNAKTCDVKAVQAEIDSGTALMVDTQQIDDRSIPRPPVKKTMVAA